MLATAKGKQIVMFLDYDGTLTPIVKDPDSAVMSEEVGQATSILSFSVSFHFSVREGGLAPPEQQGVLCSGERTHGPSWLPDAYFFCGAAADARRGERRGRALPDGDREREVQRQGTFQFAQSIIF